MATLTRNQAQALILAPFTQVTRRVDIYEKDGETLWRADVPVSDGSVTLDHSRAERRMMDLTISNDSREFDNEPNKLWYNKVIRVYRGVRYGDDTYEAPLGVFYIDRITEPHFPPVVRVTARDRTKKLLTKFLHDTTFIEGTSLTGVIKAIAIGGRIKAEHLDLIEDRGEVLDRDYTFDRDSQRWEGMTRLAKAFTYGLFFDAVGNLRMREFADPVSSPQALTLEAGEYGNLVSFDKSSDDSRIYNHVLVTGESSESAPVWAHARNTESSSPTRISELGDRLEIYSSSFITKKDQAQRLADRMLKTMALESFDLSFSSLVMPWLEVDQILEFRDPRADRRSHAPQRYLLSDITIPLKLGAMRGSAKRVTVVG